MSIRRAVVSDAAEILAVQKAAFASQVKLYGIEDLPPVMEEVASVERAIVDVIVLVAEEDGRIVGSVRGEHRDDGSVYVGRLAVEPSRQGLGLGRALLTAIEEACPDAATFELMTGDRSEQQLALYSSHGYREARREPAPDTDVMLVWLEKRADFAG